MNTKKHLQRLGFRFLLMFLIVWIIPPNISNSVSRVNAKPGTLGNQLPDLSTVGTASLVADILPGSVGSAPRSLIVYDGSLYFGANNGTTGDELWKYDGTSASLVHDINPSGHSGMRYPALYNNTLYFRADDGTKGTELYKYNGSSISLVADIRPGSGSSVPIDLIVYNGSIYFRANDNISGHELWRYNGTSTALVADIYPGSNGSIPYISNTYYPVIYNGALYFAANDGTHGSELWKYDGSSTTMIADINPVQDPPDIPANGPVSYESPYGMVVYNGSLYFAADDGVHGKELWKYDGTDVSLVEDIFPGSGSSYPAGMTIYGGMLYFSAVDGIHGIELWRYDGATASLVAEITPGNGISDIWLRPNDYYAPAIYNNELYFTAYDGTHGYELWKFNGTNVSMAADINPGSGSSVPYYLTVYDGALYFTADDGTHGPELWKYYVVPKSPLGPNIVNNGNFETPDVTSVTFDSYFGGQSFGGWTVESGSIDHISEGYWQAADGRQSVDLDGTCAVGAGAIYQNLIPSLLQTYLLRFAMSGNPEGSPAIKEMEVWWGTKLIDTLTFNTTGHSKTDMGWSFHEYIVTGTEAITKLRFKSLTPGCYGPVLDMVSVQAYSGGDIPILDLPLDYSSERFSDVALGNTSGAGGWVNSWFDHDTPDYKENTHVQVWTGKDHTDAVIANLNSTNCDTGVDCYNGHNGIDYQRQDKDENRIYAAAPGIVVDVCNDDPCYYPGTTEKIRDSAYGKWILVQHGQPGDYGKYATFYAHLSSVNVTKGTEISDTKSTPIGIMGNTGGSSTGVHLHFGVYYDANGNSRWEETYKGYTEAIDPYGWFGAANDPWWNKSLYLWKYPLWETKIGDQYGAIVTTPSGKGKLTILPGVLSSPLTLDLWDATAPAAPSTNLREVGHSIWLRVLEWLTGTAINLPPEISMNTVNATSGEFPQPVSINIRYGSDDTKHLNMNQVGIYWLDESTGTWIGLPTTLNTTLKEATAQITEIGYFDLQAPLLCPADTLEPNDNYDGSSIVQTNGSSVSNLFDIAQDEDWFRFNVVSGNTYTLTTLNLSTGVDTILEIYDTDGITLLVSDDNSGGGKASSLAWQAPTNGTYFVRVRKALGSAYGCNSSYSISININALAPTFSDVPASYWSWNYIERLYSAGITGGCATNPLKYCPEDQVSRAQMAVFLERGIHGSSYGPPAVGASTGFSDVPTSYWAAAWIKQLAADNITSGCGPDTYCPEDPVTRAQMAVFLLRSKYGSSYGPPAVGLSTGFDSDVPTNHWAAPWIKQLAAEGITSGCGTNLYCPDYPVTRAQMAVFLVRTFNLP